MHRFFNALRYVGLVIVLATTACPAAAARPNVIVILADDLGYGDTSLFEGWVKTPQIERLASEGLTFTASPSPCCGSGAVRSAAPNVKDRTRFGSKRT